MYLSAQVELHTLTREINVILPSKLFTGNVCNRLHHPPGQPGHYEFQAACLTKQSLARTSTLHEGRMLHAHLRQILY